MSSNSPTLLGLPTEIRLKIYAFTLTKVRHQHPLHLTESSRTPEINGLRLTCRLVASETTDARLVYIHNNTFRFEDFLHFCNTIEVHSTRKVASLMRRVVIQDSNKEWCCIKWRNSDEPVVNEDRVTRTINRCLASLPELCELTIQTHKYPAHTEWPEGEWKPLLTWSKGRYGTERRFQEEASRICNLLPPGLPSGLLVMINIVNYVTFNLPQTEEAPGISTDTIRKTRMMSCTFRSKAGSWVQSGQEGYERENDANYHLGL